MNTFLAELLTYFQQGGYVMPPLVIGTVVLWFAIGYRFSLLNRGNKRSVRVIIQRAERGELRKSKGMVDEAVLKGLEVRKRHAVNPRPFLDDAFGDYYYTTKKYGRLITAIVAVAPLLGLLGTVGGMIETFDSLGDMSLFSQSGGIAGGISQALFTTQMGLAVAIPGLIVKGALDRKQQEIEMDLAQIKDILCSKHTTVGVTA